ncbi:MAG: hypothetical protein D6705_18970 [Deltaproteobacteria bacterium]|nr:MAG: hypothetical protein D6705_18970 [Deltaproteobacteria bacterium]
MVPSLSVLASLAVAPASTPDADRGAPPPIAVEAPSDMEETGRTGEPAAQEEAVAPPQMREDAHGEEVTPRDVSREARAQEPKMLPEFAPDQGALDPTRAKAPSAPPSTGTDPRVPRLLATVDGYPVDEQAFVANRKKTVIFLPGLQFRNQVGFVSPFRLDAAGNRYTEGVFTQGRLRVRPQLVLGKKGQVRLVGQVDFANGRWAPRSSDDPVVDEILENGDGPQPGNLRAVDFRELYVEYTSQIGVFRLGQMAFNWGLGLLTNDGNNMDRFGDMKFGGDGDGSLNERFLFATKPLARTGGPGKDVIFALGADLVYRDPLASLVDGDLAGQGFLAVRWQPEEHPGNWLGAYAVVRGQKVADDGDVYADDDRLLVGAFDFAGAGSKKLRPKLHLLGAFETVFVGGKATFAADPGEEQRVIQLAAAGRGYVGNPDTWLAGLDLGYLSGDANPYDDEVNNFQASPGFNTGLVLHPYVVAYQSARARIEAENTDLFGVPQNGTQYLPTKGRMTNVVYFHPKARYGLLERAEIWGGPLVAFAPVPIVDPYDTTLGGGTPKNYVGGDGNRRYYGTELDVGIRVRHSYKNLWLMAGVQAGVLFPGAAFRNARGDDESTVWATFFRTEIRY